MLGEALHLQIFGGSKKTVQFVLRYVYLPMVHECDNREQLSVVYSLQEEERMLVGVPFEDRSKEGRAGREDHLVGLDLK